MVKSLPAGRETEVRSLGQEDPLGKEMATHSSILGLENPMDGEAWQATVHGITKSRTRLRDFTYIKLVLRLRGQKMKAFSEQEGTANIVKCH